MPRGGLEPGLALSLVRGMLAESDMGFVILDEALHVVYFNGQAADLLSIREEGTLFLECIDLPNREKAALMLRTMRDSGYVSDWEFSVYNGDCCGHIFFSGIWREAYAVLMLKPLPEAVSRLQDVVIQVNSDLTNLNREISRKQSQLQRAHLKIQEMHQALAEKNEMMQQDLRMAKVVQRALLDQVLDPNEKVRIEKEYHPAASVGGDLYDVTVIDENLSGILICDVSGHGVASALVMAVLKNIFRNHSGRYRRPDAYLEKMNREFLEIFGGQSFDLYATAFYLIVDTSNREIHYAGAGHPYPCHYSSDSAEELMAPGYPIGLFREGNYVSHTRPYAGGDRLLLYTDGFQEYLEAVSGGRVDLTHYDWGTVKTCFRSMAESLDGQAHHQGDDVCMMIVEFDA